MSPEEKIGFFRKIVDEKQFAIHSPTGQKKDEFLVDLFTASVVCQVHDAISPGNKAKLLSLPIDQIAHNCLSLVG